ncbi:DUF1783-domain-containing protein [Piedraia hortae CBS 480.64]|uniref:DUF1783-domain-containing protein n=1 Tax=Piedraia hortae CBS 480.64 TaxID=1314780 RepID=A0A6A7C9G7_9PEZI|nr:DUF1783-domain-containing protein [Piedraia hortae CBS 480.64]
MRARLSPRLRTSSIRPIPEYHNGFRRCLGTSPRHQRMAPLMERRADRELPTISDVLPHWSRTLPVFVLIMIGSTLAILNHQKQTSSIVASTLYALRTNPAVREILGDEIYFASRYPWIWGAMDPMGGLIDIQYWVKGTKGRGLMRFRSERKTKHDFFQTVKWTLQLEGCQEISLLTSEGSDPLEQYGNS